MPPYCEDQPKIPSNVAKRFKLFLKKQSDSDSKTDTNTITKCQYYCTHNSALTIESIGERCLNQTGVDDECLQQSLNNHPESTTSTIVRPVDGYVCCIFNS
jgi:hypothetical protein